jgi:nitroreductase
MDLEQLTSRRRMTRRFDGAPLAPDLRDKVLRAAASAPSAGHSQGVDFLVIEEAAGRQRFFEETTDPSWRNRRGGSAEDLIPAPLLVLPLADPGGYVARYALADKAASGLAGLAAEEWPVPYWLVDAAFATMLLLLAATDAGLGALFFRLHRDPAAYLAAAGVPPDRQVIGAVAIGWPHPDGERLRPTRPGRPWSERIHFDSW